MLLNREIQILQAELNVRADIACALAGRYVSAGQCTSQVLAAGAEDFRTCRACHHGQELARSSGWPMHDLPLQAEYPAWAKRPRAKVPPLDFGKARTACEPDPQQMLAKLIQALPQRQITVDVDPAKDEDMTSEVTMASRHDGSLEIVSVHIKRPRQPRTEKPVQAVLPIQTAPQKPERAPAPTCRACGWPRPKTATWPETDLCNSCAPADKPIRPKRLAKPSVPKPAPTVCEISQVEVTPAQPQLDHRLVELAHALRELTSDGRLRVSMLDLMRRMGATNYDEAASLVHVAGLRTSRLYGPIQTVLMDHSARQLLERAAASEVRQ